MKFYFFGDIHGNVAALDACLRHMDQAGADEVFCLGDLAGWLPFGDKTFARMRSAGYPTVAGNHDLLIAGAITDHPNQIDRMQATAYNAALLSGIPGAIEYILDLPLAIERKDFTVVHHSPFSLPPGNTAPTIASFNYLDGEELKESIDSWRNHPRRLIVSGHDHVPAVFELPEGSLEVKTHCPRGVESLTVSMKEGSMYWVKAGSVGGPYRDGVPMANSVLYDSGPDTITLFRIGYDTAELGEALSSHRFYRNLPTMRKYVDLLRSRRQAGA